MAESILPVSPQSILRHLAHSNSNPASSTNASSPTNTIEEVFNQIRQEQEQQSFPTLAATVAPERERVVMLGRRNKGYATNFVSTCKYTPLTFLPKNLFEQFMRLANFYFLIMTVIQCIPAISPFAPWTSILPLTFVLSVTAIKEAYEDILRSRMDRASNEHAIEVLVVKKQRPQRAALTNLLQSSSSNNNFAVANNPNSLREPLSPNNSGRWDTADFTEDQNLLGQWSASKWKDIRVGDVVRVTEGDELPCDILLLHTSEEESMCYVETTNLDGETNLKMLQAHPTLVNAFSKRGEVPFRGHLMCELPNNDIHKFLGRFQLESESRGFGVDIHHIGLRGSTLRNTQWIVGVAIYTGVDTKLMMNSATRYIKQSQLEARANYNIAIMLTIQLCICVLASICCSHFANEYHTTMWYLGLETIDLVGFLAFFTWLALISTLIPISLFVSVEIVKLAQAWFMSWDEAMFTPETNSYTKARTSNLNEELGQVQYVFADKTGTLTNNQMEVRMCAVGEDSFGQPPSGVNSATTNPSLNTTAPTPTLQPPPPREQLPNTNTLVGASTLVDARFDAQLTDPNGTVHDELHRLLLALSLCHTVVRGQSGALQGASPDEVALVKFAESKGYRFEDRNTHSMTVSLPTSTTQPPHVQSRTFGLLNVLPFDSVRKCMSVVLRDPRTNRVLLITKGADNVMLPKLSASTPKGTVGAHLQRFSVLGLRTLVVSQRELDDDQFSMWSAVWNRAEGSLRNREEALARAAALVETDMQLVGVTAIEDKLQRGVPSTVSTLLRANINVWMLTGDKEETAVNIAQSCNLLSQSVETYTITATKQQSKQQVEAVLQQISHKVSTTQNCIQLVIDGRSLEWCFTQDFGQLFLRLIPYSKAVVCCRATPLQKAQLVNLVKTHLGKITLAIGDGANDVPMIKAAHIGIGVEGQEGQQATRASDYSVGQFRSLARLLLVHGRFSYNRISLLFLYCFYKNYAFTLCHVWFGVFSLFSGQSLFTDATVAVVNLFYTAVPILLVGVYERDINASTALENPEMYIRGQQGKAFRLRRFWWWILLGSLQSLPLFFIPMFVLGGSSTSSGHQAGVWISSSCCTLSAVLTANIKLLLEAHLFNWMHGAALVFGVVSVFWVSFLYEVYLTITDPANPVIGTMEAACSTPLFWLVTVLCVGIAVLPDFVLTSWGKLFNPCNELLLREAETLQPTTTPRSAYDSI